MIKKALPFLTITLLLVIGCSTPPIERNYYVVDYNPVPNNPKLILSEALPFRVQVPDSRISKIYDRSQLVFRHSAHKIEYSPYDLWAVRLSSAIADAMTNHFVRYNTFSVTQRDFLIEKPDYEIVTNINRLEFLKSDYYKAVHLDMDVFLRKGSDLSYLTRHSFNREVEVYSDEVEIFVQQLSKIVKEETDLFIEKVLIHFDALQVNEE
jgi:uncharacterized lipoprotein YmbA